MQYNGKGNSHGYGVPFRRQPADGHYTNTPVLQEFQFMTLLLGDDTVRM